MPLSVITAAESSSLTTLTRVKAELGITDTSSDFILSEFIKSASAQIENYCGRKFAKEVVEETIPSSGSYRFQLERFPVNSITYVKYQGTTVDSTYYILSNPKAGFLDYLDGTWTYTGGDYDYVIRYDCGYVLPSFTTGTRNLPYDLEQAAVNLVKHLKNNQDVNENIAKEVVPQVYEVTYTSNIAGNTNAAVSTLPASVTALLQPYKVYKI